MRIPFGMQLMTGSLIISLTLAVIGLNSLALPPPAAFGCGLAMGGFGVVWFGGIWFKFIKPGRDSTGRSGAGGQGD